jgi:hypothetical protein
MTELACFDLPATDVTTLRPETALHEFEATTHQTGNAILRHLLQMQWETIDTALAELHRQRFSPERPSADGRAPVTVATRFGTLELSRQVYFHADTQIPVMPGNTVLPPHNGMIITRGLHLLGLLTATRVILCVGRPPAWRPRRRRRRSLGKPPFVALSAATDSLSALWSRRRWQP